MQDARRWVVDTCRDIDRPELVECAELAVSELVTNALLHGEAPIQVRVRGTREHPRVEVRDGSPERPVLPSAEDEGDDVLLTFGRGLAIVGRCSDAWGAEIEADGKTVWFAPARTFSDTVTPGLITGVAAEPDEVPADAVTAVVRDVPVEAFLEFGRHFRELRREVRLLSLAHESDYPLAKDLSDLFGDLERQLRAGTDDTPVLRAQADGAERVDLDVVVSPAASRTIERFISLLDLADEFCRQQRLLSLARSPEQRTFQEWYLQELVRQSRGEPSVPAPRGDFAAVPLQRLG
ncbi:MAG: ATP-binding protein [Nocardioides sp.]|uniref:ATP-binding protein n=1 Tax=Nocardioides sp. TaxID=35761 RepID=UPI00345D1954